MLNVHLNDFLPVCGLWHCNLTALTRKQARAGPKPVSNIVLLSDKQVDILP